MHQSKNIIQQFLLIWNIIFNTFSGFMKCFSDSGYNIWLCNHPTSKHPTSKHGLGVGVVEHKFLNFTTSMFEKLFVDKIFCDLSKFHLIFHLIFFFMTGVHGVVSNVVKETSKKSWRKNRKVNLFSLFFALFVASKGS